MPPETDAKQAKYDRTYEALMALKALTCVADLLASIADRGGDMHQVDPDAMSLLISRLADDIRPALEL